MADQATALRPVDSELAVQLSLAAYRLAPNPHTRSSLLSTLPRSVVSHAIEVYGLAFSPDGRILATCSDDHTVRLWNVNDSPAPDGTSHYHRPHRLGGRGGLQSRRPHSGHRR